MFSWTQAAAAFFWLLPNLAFVQAELFGGHRAWEKDV